MLGWESGSKEAWYETTDPWGNKIRKPEQLYLFNKKKKFLCVVMDVYMAKMSNWEGELKMMFGSNLFVCMDGDFQDEKYFNVKMK